MALTMDMGSGPRRSVRERQARRRQGLMLGASAALHLLVLGPIILLAQGEELVFDLSRDFPIIQLQLEPPQTVPPPPLPVPDPRQVTPVPTQTQPPRPTEAEPQQQAESLQTPQRPAEVWPVTRDLPQLAPQPAPPQPETLDQTAGTPSLNPLDRALPSVSPLPPLPSETLETSGSRAAPSAVTVAPPSVSPSQSAAEAAAADTAASDLPVRRRDEEAERAAAAAAAAASSGPPAPPQPRIGNPAPGVPLPSAGVGGGAPVPGVSEAWRVAPSSQADRNSRALRVSPLGCRYPERLTEGERQLCEERFNADAARGAQNPISGSGNAARDARFRAQGARELYRYEEQRRPLSGGTGNVGPADCPGSNFGTGCAGSLLDPSMQMDSSSNIRTKRDGPRPSGPQVPGSAGAASRPGSGSD